MPLYEYECDCGKRFEARRPIASRLSATCECGATPRLLMSLQRAHRVAHTFTTYGHDGRIIGRRQTAERTPIVGESSEHEVTKV